MLKKSIQNNASSQYQEYSFAGYWLIYQPITSRALILNDTSRFICHQYDNGSSIERIRDKLTTLYDISVQTADKDIEQCLEEWQEYTSDNNEGQQNNFLLRSTPVVIPVSSVIVTRYRFNYYFRIAGETIRISLNNEYLKQILLGIIGHLEDNKTEKFDTTIEIQHQQGQYRVIVNASDLYVIPDKSEAIAKIIYEMVESCYRQKEHIAVLHASAVAHDNCALVFAGCQGSGKSTLTAALQAHGFNYLADDVCPIIDNKLIPVPMSQVMKQGSWEPLQKIRPELCHKITYQRMGQPVRYLPPINSSTNLWDKNWPVSALIFPEYQVGADLRCRAMNPVDTLCELIHSGALFQEQIAQILPWLEIMPAYSLQYGNISQAILGVKSICNILEV